MTRVELLSKPDCCLCDQAKEVLERVRRSLPFELEIRDISEDPELLREYGEHIPVVLIEGRKAFKYHVDQPELERRLRRARDR
jgi:glutaredoxin